MPSPSTRQLLIALSNDFNKAGAKPLTTVVDDVPRKTFTAHKDHAVFEFPHKQVDAEYWNGVKYYGGGTRNKIRIRRTPSEVVEEKAAAKAPRLKTSRIKTKLG